MFGGFALVFGHASEKNKTRASSWFQGKEFFFVNLIFTTFVIVIYILKKWYSSHKFSKYLRYEMFFLLQLKRKCKKIDAKLGRGEVHCVVSHKSV